MAKSQGKSIVVKDMGKVTVEIPDWLKRCPYKRITVDEFYCYSIRGW